MGYISHNSDGSMSDPTQDQLEQIKKLKKEMRENQEYWIYPFGADFLQDGFYSNYLNPIGRKYWNEKLTEILTVEVQS